MRLLLAARLSQLAKGQTGIDTQDEDARRWAQEHGHTIVATAADRISGRVPPAQRRNLGPWLSEPARVATYDGILVSKIDRLTRKRDWDIRQWAEENGKKILVVQPELMWPPEKGDTATPIIWDNLVNLAAGEWDNTSMRYQRMQKHLREQAYFVGKPPYGYRIVLVDGTDHKTLEPDPVTAAIAKGIASRYLDGQSLRQISNWLTAEAIPVPQQPKGREGKGWTDQAVRRILRNPAMIGRIQVKGRTYLKVTPLITAEDHKRILMFLTDKAWHRGPREGTTALLTGILACPDGHPMYRLQSRKIPTVPDGLYYYCRECPKGERLLVPLQHVERLVSDAVMEQAELPYITTEIIPGDDYADEIEQVKRDISGLDPESRDYDTQLVALRGELKRLRGLPGKPAQVIHKAHGRTIGQVWPALDTTADRRSFLLANESKITAHRDPDGTVRVTGVRVRMPQL